MRFTYPDICAGNKSPVSLFIHCMQPAVFPVGEKMETLGAVQITKKVICAVSNPSNLNVAMDCNSVQAKMDHKTKVK